MLCQSALPFRTVSALSYRIQPSILAPFAPCSSAAYSTAPRQAQPPQLPATVLLRKAYANTRPTHRPTTTTFPPSISSVRFDSSASPTTAAQTASPSAPESTLTWNRFLALRKTRRRINTVASIISMLGTTALGVVFISTRDLDTLGSQMFGLDPIITLGLATVGFAGAGWLIGPLFGSAVFNLWYKRLRADIAMKERAFYARIKKYRVDPSASSIANPVPDYYGEKIGSVADYRRWLKDQRAFNLKRGKTL